MGRKEYVAVFAGIFVVGFFFIFGSQALGILQSFQPASAVSSKILVQDEVVGTGTTVVSGSKVTVNYVGRFPNGQTFDSSLSRGPFQFIVGQGQVIPGFDQGIVGMKEGGKRVISVPPELGYGSNAYGPIPANSTLIFEVEVLKVQ